MSDSEDNNIIMATGTAAGGAIGGAVGEYLCGESCAAIGATIGSATGGAIAVKGSNYIKKKLSKDKKKSKN